jgi:uncharacterized protein (DUF1501 family)
MARHPETRVGFLSAGGWDTHVNQGSARGPLANRLRFLGQGLAALVEELGPVYAETAIAVLSEFGRTVGENGNGGTDHGHGTAIWLAGGSLRGGQIHGEWPGLEADRLYEGRDLAVTTDFREVLAAVLTQHLGLSATQVRTIFPGYSPGRRLALI